MAEILNYNFWGNSLLVYLSALGIFLGIVILVKIINSIVLSRIKTLAAKTRTSLDDFAIDLIERLVIPFSYFFALYLALKSLALTPELNKHINTAAMAVLIIFVVKSIISLITYGLKKYWEKVSCGNSLQHSLAGIIKVIKFIIWSLAIIFFLDNLGFKISTVIAGLGIGGVAIALAAQAVLKDLFSYFSIIFDRPFEIGDFIIVGDLMGTIEHVGIKTTRIRSLSGEELVFSNSDLTDSRLRNYKRMQKRRVVFKLGVVYGTKLAELKEIPEIIKACIGNVKDTVFDRAHFAAYGDFSLIFEAVYYVLSSDYNKYMDIHQEINFSLKEEFERRGIEFAFPTQTIYLNKQT